MDFGFGFFVEAVLLGIALAMDAFSVSMANGLNEPYMKKRKTALIAGVFALFQLAMPLLGWLCVHTVATAFEAFQKFIPWIALLLLGFIGTKMLIEGIKNKENTERKENLGLLSLIVQGIATSIDALSVGFVISDFSFPSALVESLIIGFVTFVICIAGVLIGRKFGTKLSGKASIFGGIILIGIGIEIFVTGLI